MTPRTDSLDGLRVVLAVNRRTAPIRNNCPALVNVAGEMIACVPREDDARALDALASENETLRERVEIMMARLRVVEARAGDIFCDEDNDNPCTARGVEYENMCQGCACRFDIQDDCRAALPATSTKPEGGA